MIKLIIYFETFRLFPSIPRARAMKRSIGLSCVFNDPSSRQSLINPNEFLIKYKDIPFKILMSIEMSPLTSVIFISIELKPSPALLVLLHKHMIQVLLFSYHESRDKCFSFIRPLSLELN